MKTILMRVGGGLAVLIVVLLAVIYGGSEWKLRRGTGVALTPIAVPTDAASIAEGGRLARLEGCRHCHGPNGEGAVLADDFMIGRIAPPAFAVITQTYSNEELARAIRHGVRRDGTALWVMPTQSHRYIADDDLGKIIAWMRTVKPGPNDSTATMRFGPLGRALALFGVFKPSVQAETVAPPTRPADTGQYFAQAVCTGCHAMDHARPADDGSGVMVPALAQVGAAYNLAQFTLLLRTGQGASRRDLGMMREAAVAGFGQFTDAEIAEIHAYLVKEALLQSGSD